ncbi:hypothetical protein AX15_001999 [Amanita polypyramis BW_CC]|nr:hypothetical protein AX15_001999 [Amanita polypyramis BW_CC]
MGVKSLWNLLAPVGRPILLETVEGKAMAIDSSIWIYQFQATMRDKDGRVLVNAHVLGFLRRITKLLFHGIKPVFVFDGGAPVLKRNTLKDRKRKKSGAATSHAKLAEKLLAARLRKEALERTQGASNKGEKKAEDEDKVMYLEDVDPTMPKARPRHEATDSTTTGPDNSPAKRKAKFYDHDPYRLPEVDLEAAVAKATRSAVPDPRLATEEELRGFIEEMRPEDLDIASAEFRQLPTEVQYEIIGDLRLKSRQTSHARLEKILRHSRTAMDFSKAQIQGLRQRNALTQQLLITTDNIGKSHLSIPVRIASERNKEYVLVKNETEAGGWILGIRDHGTQEKPIVIDRDDGRCSGDEDMEEVEVPTAGPMDRDLRQFQSEMALRAIARRKTDKGLASLTTQLITHNGPKKKSQSTPLSDPDGGGDDNRVYPRVDVPENEDEALPSVIQASLDDVRMKVTDETQPITAKALPSSPQGINGEIFVSPSRLETVLSFANISPPSSKTARKTFHFGRPSLLSNTTSDDVDAAVEMDVADNGLDDAYIDIGAFPTTPQTDSTLDLPETMEPNCNVNSSIGVPTVIDIPAVDESQILDSIDSDSDEDMEEVFPEQNFLLSVPETPQEDDFVHPNRQMLAVTSSTPHQPEPGSQVSLSVAFVAPEGALSDEQEGDDEEQIPWSRSPSPAEDVSKEGLPNQAIDESWDAAQEMDSHAEEGEFARFMSQVKGKDFEEIRREIDDEIESLNQQRKAAMRDSEDITQHMIAQIMAMLRLFGIPYITAPMEAEAQCAELVSLGLVDGVITDDSDVFLFGAQRVFKNMFNQSKTVECFLLSDLSRELGLDRDTLIRLAYLLGSDYVEGLPGIGPVVAMELLKEFPGMDGLHKFRDWWMRVQSGKDTMEDSKSKFRQRFKKKFKSLYLDEDWPNPAVRDAYYHPAVDSSDELFKWGLPDLDGLRQFFHKELGWQQSKVDELLLPIIQKMNKRGQAAAINKQSNLTEYFDVSAGMGAFVPRKQQAYTSKRLQDVVEDFRKRQKADASTSVPESVQDCGRLETNEDGADEYNESSRKRRKAGQRGQRVKKGVTSGKYAKKRKLSEKAKEVDSEDESLVNRDINDEVRESTSSLVQLRPRPRPAYKGAKPVTEETSESN